MAGICATCLTTTNTLTKGECQNCARTTDRTRRPPGRTRYPAEYRYNRAPLIGQPCHWCGAKADTADHRVPISHGGGHEPSNLLPSCSDCNRRRGNRTMEQFTAILETERRGG